MSSSTSETITPPLSQGVGYGLIVGAGFGFAFFMIYITYLLKKFNNENNKHFETFATAGRKIGTGLTATAVIASWSWPTAVLSSSVVTWNYGVGGAFWFASGCLVQISFFALLAIQSKLKTPHAHTILEVVKSRYGTGAHVLYSFLCLATNLIASINMLLGAGAGMSALTGINVISATFLFPLSVAAYTAAGGLKATLVTDFIRTSILLFLAVYLCIKTVLNEELNGLSGFYDLLVKAGGDALAPDSYIKDNHADSYLTMTSPGALQFGVLHTLGNLGLVIMDSSYWQKAYSADISAAVPGYILGSILYFGIPFSLGTVLGLGGVALQNFPEFPTRAFGRGLSMTELSAGLVLPYTAQTVAGKGGAAAAALIIFLTCTSTISAQLVAVSSILSLDVYRTYLNKKATDKQTIAISRWACLGFAVFASGFSVFFYEVGLDLTWTLYFLGIITTPGMITLPLTVLWSRQTKLAAIISPSVGIVAGIGVWLGTASHYAPGGTLDVKTTGALLPCLWGTITATVVPVILTPTISLIWPTERFDWARFNDIKLVSNDDSSSVRSEERISKPSEKEDEGIITPDQERFMRSRSWVAGWVSLFLFLAVWIIWPFGMYGARYVFSRQFFEGWVVVSIIWVFAALLIVFFLPLWEGKDLLLVLTKGALGFTPAHPKRGEVAEKLPEFPADDTAVNSGNNSINENEKAPAPQ